MNVGAARADALDLTGSREPRDGTTAVSGWLTPRNRGSRTRSCASWGHPSQRGWSCDCRFFLIGSRDVERGGERGAAVTSPAWHSSGRRLSDQRRERQSRINRSRPVRDSAGPWGGLRPDRNARWASQPATAATATTTPTQIDVADVDLGSTAFANA